MSTRNVTEINLVAYLRIKGFGEIDRPHFTRPVVTFYFEDSPELQKEIDAYYGRKVLVEPTAMSEALRLLRSQILDVKKNQRAGGGLNE
jgi:hypothetical protein